MMSVALQIVGCFAAAAMFALLFRTPARLIVPASLSAVAGYALSLWAGARIGAEWAGIFFGSVLSALIGRVNRRQVDFSVIDRVNAISRELATGADALRRCHRAGPVHCGVCGLCPAPEGHAPGAAARVIFPVYRAPMRAFTRWTPPGALRGRRLPTTGTPSSSRAQGFFSPSDSFSISMT